MPRFTQQKMYIDTPNDAAKLMIFQQEKKNNSLYSTSRAVVTLLVINRRTTIICSCDLRNTNYPVTPLTTRRVTKHGCGVGSDVGKTQHGAEANRTFRARGLLGLALSSNLVKSRLHNLVTCQVEVPDRFQVFVQFIHKRNTYKHQPKHR